MGVALLLSVALVVLPRVPEGGEAKTVLSSSPVRLGAGRIVKVKAVFWVGSSVPVM